MVRQQNHMQPASLDLYSIYPQPFRNRETMSNKYICASSFIVLQALGQRNGDIDIEMNNNGGGGTAYSLLIEG